MVQGIGVVTEANVVPAEIVEGTGFPRMLPRGAVQVQRLLGVAKRVADAVLQP